MCVDFIASEDSFLVFKIIWKENFSHQCVNLAMRDVSWCRYERL